MHTQLSSSILTETEDGEAMRCQPFFLGVNSTKTQQYATACTALKLAARLKTIGYEIENVGRVGNQKS